MAGSPSAEIQAAVEWGQFVLLGAGPSPVNRAVRILGSLGVPALTSRARRDGSASARTTAGDFTLTEVLELTQKLREAGMHLTLRAGIISTDRPRRQGKPPESGLLRDRQRTLATFTFPDPDTYDPQTVDALLERNGWHQHGQRVVLTSSGGARRVLVLVEYDIEEQLTRRPWWPAQPQHLAQAAGPQREAA